MEKNTTEILKKTLKEFYCKKCDYKCARKSDFNKHLKSKKHNTTNTTKIQPNILHSCECGKSYNHRASLFNHKKSCTYTEDDIIDASMEPVKKDSNKVELCKEIFPYLKDMMLEIMPKMQSTTINTTNYNNHLMEENVELKKMIMENYGRNVTNK